ncbi:MAG: phosphoenolpyruvate carboxykinase (GTP) [Microbacteriaceae bacterium]|nr:phosphoenolpyruvate carboxykinase (GTP) [Microbacteriaceae bacterium]
MTAAAINAPDIAPANLKQWVAEMAELLKPDSIEWYDGSEANFQLLTEREIAAGRLIRLNPELRPNSFLARTDPGDVARVEERTFIATETQEETGPTNNWRHPDELKEELKPHFDGSMRGRIMYVIPFSMGPVGGPISYTGVQLTDSAYATLNMHIMTRTGNEPLAAMGEDSEFVRGVHSVGYPLVDVDGNTRPDTSWPCNETKYITHFPDTREIFSYGSGYGGNALLGKKCFALRIASVIGRDEGWLAEHMLLIKVSSPEGKVTNIAAAFPSACGKTNLAMLQPTIPGWKVETLGDDIVWMRPGEDGRLWAINPEAGFFGVAPGTGIETNPNAVETLRENVIFTNVALSDEGDVWWEGLTPEAPKHLIDWRGRDWTPESGVLAAHPNSRFTAPIEQTPSLAAEWDALGGVPVDAIVFGGRRTTNVPLVAQSYSWQHGVFMGATIASEQTAAAEGPVGELRRDPFAMLPFCGYNMADYWNHWLKMGALLGDKAPRIFQVNWFRKNKEGKFLWPGFGENSRVLEWISKRVQGRASATPSPIGNLPTDLNIEGLEISDETMKELFAINPEAWLYEADLTDKFFEMFGDKVPKQLRLELLELRGRLNRA